MKNVTTPEEIAEKITEDFIGQRDQIVLGRSDFIEALTDAAEAGRDLPTGTAPDFKPAEQFDYYRSMFADLAGAESLMIRISGNDGSGTNHLNITKDQARRILVMLSTEGEGV